MSTTTKATKAQKATDKRIERSYYRTSSGVQIPMLAIPKIYREAREFLASSPEASDEALDQKTTEIVGRYRVN